jgi:hypothetical protein
MWQHVKNACGTCTSMTSGLTCQRTQAQPMCWPAWHAPAHAQDSGPSDFDTPPASLFPALIQHHEHWAHSPAATICPHANAAAPLCTGHSTQPEHKYVAMHCTLQQCTDQRPTILDDHTIATVIGHQASHGGNWCHNPLRPCGCPIVRCTPVIPYPARHFSQHPYVTQRDIFTALLSAEHCRVAASRAEWLQLAAPRDVEFQANQ